MGWRKKISRNVRRVFDENKGTVIGAATGGLALGGAGAGTVVGAAGGAARDSEMAQRRMDEELNGEQEALYTEEMTRRNNAIRQIRELFGMGGTEAAVGNQARLGDWLKTYYDAQLKQGTRAADDQFATLSRTTRQNLARAGQLQSGTGAQAQASTLADYLRERSRALVQAAQARDGLRSSLDQQRRGLEQTVSNGGTFDLQQAIAGQRATVDSAQRQVLPNALASGLNAGSNAMRGWMINQGPTAFFAGSGGGLS